MIAQQISVKTGQSVSYACTCSNLSVSIVVTLIGGVVFLVFALTAFLRDTS